MTRMAEVRRELGESYVIFVPDSEWNAFFDDLIVSEPDLGCHRLVRLHQLGEIPRAYINENRRKALRNDEWGAYLYLLYGNELFFSQFHEHSYPLVDLCTVWCQEADHGFKALDETAIMSLI